MQTGGPEVIFFILVWLLFMGGFLGGVVIGIAALISAARLPAQAFGPWWDNTKTAWLLGIAVSYMIPFGMWVSGIYWFTRGRREHRQTGIAGRPFWVGPPKPQPLQPGA
jgi:hypothetical protein